MASAEPSPPGRLLIVPPNKDRERKPNATAKSRLRPNDSAAKYRIKTSQSMLARVISKIGAKLTDLIFARPA